ncbi:MAG: hypothetical protein LBK08_10935 [Treponema sp.]|nr:hypothetical protein [Treponema sp.]
MEKGISAMYRVFRPIFFLCLCGIWGTAFAQNTSAVLVRGNAWVSGLPGIGENAFPCFFGDYRIAGAAASANTAASADTNVSANGGAPLFSVYICREALVFSERLWQMRPGFPGRGAVQRREDGSLFVCFPSESGFWTVMFRFPSEGFDGPALDRFAAVWLERFRYFFSLAKGISDISFPAVVNF